MLTRLSVENYRSLRSAWLDLGRLTVITGPNGSGKSNLYRALALLQAAAEGRFARALLAEGGMPSALWAGPRKKGPVRMSLLAQFTDFTYSLSAGLVSVQPPNPFVLDPEVKEEALHLGAKKSTATTLVDRRGTTSTLTDADGNRNRLAGRLQPAESVLSQVGDPGNYPEIAEIRRRFAGWRFYHQFDTGPASPIRRVQPGVRTPALASDGSDLAAAIATIEENGDGRALVAAVANAFPGYEIATGGSGTPGEFGIGLGAHGLARPLAAVELSDGQLRFLCLATALLSTRPPELLVLNEPETSLHPAAVRALAPLILDASRFGQVIVTTHDEELRHALAEHATMVRLEVRAGATVVEPDEA